MTAFSRGACALHCFAERMRTSSRAPLFDSRSFKTGTWLRALEQRNCLHLTQHVDVPSENVLEQLDTQAMTKSSMRSVAIQQ